MSAPVLTKEQRERLGRWPQDNPSLCQDIVAALAHIDALKAELEAVSERCAMTVKDRNRWNEMYNAEARKHVNAVTALRAERDALAAKVAVLAEEVKAWRAREGLYGIHNVAGGWHQAVDALIAARAATDSASALNG